MDEPMFPTATAMAAWRKERIVELEAELHLSRNSVGSLRTQVEALHPALVAHKTRIHELEAEVRLAGETMREIDVVMSDKNIRITRLEAALHALVDGTPVVEGAFDHLDGPYCLYCHGDDWHGGDIAHREDCPVVKARALLKGEGDDGQR